MIAIGSVDIKQSFELILDRSKSFKSRLSILMIQDTILNLVNENIS